MPEELGQLGAKLRSVKGGVMFYCPACKVPHIAPLNSPTGANWSWDGSILTPTIVPSLVNTRPGWRCHLLIKNGKLKYFSDCTHGFAEKEIPMPDLPRPFQD